MACDFLNKSLESLKKSSPPNARNWEECYKGLDEYSSDEDLAQVLLFLDYPEPLLKFAAACSCIFMILGIPGNIVTIIALSQYRKVRNATAIFIINMSVCDLLIACTIMPNAISLFLNQSWMSGKMLCRLFPALSYFLSGAVLLTIMAITINRYVLVLHPLHYPILYQTRNLIIMIVAIWVGAFLIIVPVLFEIWGRFSLDPRVGFCTIIPDKNNNSPKAAILITSFVIPSAIIVICYSRIMYIVRKSTVLCNCKRPITNAQSDTTSRTQEIPKEEIAISVNNQEEGNHVDVESSPGMLTYFNKIWKGTFRRKRADLTAPTTRDKRLQSMIVAIMISFFSCHFPIMTAELVNRDFAAGPYRNIMGYMLFFMTICSNPIIYVVMSKEYRQAYKSAYGYLCSLKLFINK